jgi:hypothetical protein
MHAPINSPANRWIFLVYSKHYSGFLRAGGKRRKPYPNTARAGAAAAAKKMGRT